MKRCANDVRMAIPSNAKMLRKRLFGPTLKRSSAWPLSNATWPPCHARVNVRRHCSHRGHWHATLCGMRPSSHPVLMPCERRHSPCWQCHEMCGSLDRQEGHKLLSTELHVLIPEWDERERKELQAQTYVPHECLCDGTKGIWSALDPGLSEPRDAPDDDRPTEMARDRRGRVAAVRAMVEFTRNLTQAGRWPTTSEPVHGTSSSPSLPNSKFARQLRENASNDARHARRRQRDDTQATLPHAPSRLRPKQRRTWRFTRATAQSATRLPECC